MNDDHILAVLMAILATATPNTLDVPALGTTASKILHHAKQVTRDRVREQFQMGVAG